MEEPQKLLHQSPHILPDSTSVKCLDWASPQKKRDSWLPGAGGGGTGQIADKCEVSFGSEQNVLKLIVTVTWQRESSRPSYWWVLQPLKTEIFREKDCICIKHMQTSFSAHYSLNNTM